MSIERFKLHQVPFVPPTVHIGETINCVIHGPQPVLGFSDGRIAWPLIRAAHGGRAVPALAGSLIKAVRRESKQAIVYWWGVSEKTVWRWRNALDVPSHNEGTLDLRRAYAAESLHTPAAKERAAESARDPKRRAQASAQFKGQPRSPEVIAKMSAALSGRVFNAEWRRRIAAEKRLAALRYRACGRPWAPAEDAIVLRLEARRAARRVGRSLRAVVARQRFLLRRERESSGACPR
jgi:hypothetical protein